MMILAGARVHRLAPGVDHPPGAAFSLFLEQSPKSRLLRSRVYGLGTKVSRSRSRFGDCSRKREE